MLGNRIAEARRRKGWTQRDLADHMGTTQQTIQRYEAGARDIKASVLVDLSRVLDVSVAYLLGMTDSNSQRTESVEAPLYGTIAAGKPIEMIAADAYYPIPAQVYEQWPHAFLLRVEGESMNRILPNGCYALIDPCSEVINDGQPYAIRIGDNNATIKRIRRIVGGYELLPDSTDPSFQPQQLDKDDFDETTFTVIGHVVWHCLPYEWLY